MPRRKTSGASSLGPAWISDLQPQPHLDFRLPASSPAWISDSQPPGLGENAYLLKPGPSGVPCYDRHGKLTHSFIASVFAQLEIVGVHSEMRTQILLYSYLKEDGDCDNLQGTCRPLNECHHSQACVFAPGSILQPWVL